MSINWKIYQALEQIPDSVVSHAQAPRTGLRLRYLWMRLTMGLTDGQVPFVWKTRSRSGQTYWNTFDSRTGRTALLMSEQEFDAWLQTNRFQC